MVALLVVMVPAAALGTPAQQQFQNYQSPTLGVSIQYPSDWKLLEESNDKLRFIKQEGFVTADLNVEEIDQSDATLPEYANTRVNELRTQRPDFQLLSLEPTMISNDIPAQKVVYTFEREEDGKTNKVMRIWSINEGKLYTLAYIAESSQYDRYLPAFQRMVDSFRIDNTTIQVESGDRSREDNDGNGNCDRTSYPDPDVCIPPYPPDLNCPDIPYKNFKVTGNDPHGFDRDNDGIGCESPSGAPPPRPPPGDGKCDPSYPTVCIKPPPPDLNCPDIPYKNFKVTGNDPHRFDGDNDGIGCDSADSGGVKPPDNGNGECIEDQGYLLSKGSYIDTGNNAIVGSPCNPTEFCDDPSSTDPVVIDHCEDIWTDDDDKEELPLCDSEDAKRGEPCRDEGDPDDCEPGFVDRGFGCEPEDVGCVDIFPPPPGCGGSEEEIEEIDDENDTLEPPAEDEVADEGGAVEEDENADQGESGPSEEEGE